MKALRIVWLAALASALCAQSANVNDLIAAQRNQIESSDFRAVGHLVWVQPSGVRLSYPVTIKAHWFPGVLRETLEMGVAPKAGENAPLGGRLVTQALFEMRPNGQHAIWIAHPGDKSATLLPFEKWSEGPLGPDFSYEDFLEQQNFWPGQATEGMQKIGARDCDVVRSTPGPADRTHYAQVKTLIDPSIEFPVYSEKTMKGSGAVKEFTAFGIRHEQGVWSAHQIEAKIRGQEGSALLIIDRGTVKAHLTQADFSPSQLTRF